ncbi:MAG: trigger factor, partial [Alphaproteobacteria bacterium]
MQVTETLNEGLKRGYTITVTAAELDAKVQEKLLEAQPEVEIKGFRKGKVPLAILKKQFGSRILGDAMQEAIDAAMRDHFDKTGDRPALQPEVKMVGGESWKEGQDVVVEMTYDALPPIPDVDASAISLDRLIVKADDKAIDEALENLAKSAQNFEDRKKGAKAKDGDQVVIDFKGSVDGELFEGGSAEDYPLVLGSKSFIPGFEDQLIGAKVGDEKTVKVTFPAEYPVENLKGAKAEFAVTVKEVKVPAASKIDDEFAKSLGLESL